MSGTPENLSSHSKSVPSYLLKSTLVSTCNPLLTHALPHLPVQNHLMSKLTENRLLSSKQLTSLSSTGKNLSISLSVTGQSSLTQLSNPHAVTNYILNDVSKHLPSTLTSTSAPKTDTKEIGLKTMKTGAVPRLASSHASGTSAEMTLVHNKLVTAEKPIGIACKREHATELGVRNQKTKKKKKIVSPSVHSETSMDNAEYFDVPDYKLESQHPPELKIPLFVSVDKMDKIDRISQPAVDIRALKKALVNTVSASLIGSPNFRLTEDAVRSAVVDKATAVAECDPEFVLKVALYTRCELNIRTTANFLLAYASHFETCRPYLHKYFCASVRLPSDWIEVAELCQPFHNSPSSAHSLPAALRRAMMMKFPEFDQYQLGKYNKEGSLKKKKKLKAKKTTAEESSEEPMQTNTAEIKFTMKQLIRKLHIVEPVENVMCIIGKKYPPTMEEFYQSHLPGTFDEGKAGKRMKLPVPETWETQVSLHGNKASVWQDLIDHKKLPFMAMLRNLRNLIKAGISDKHHSWVLRKLTDEGAVANSRQFPFRFFSAYEVLQQLEDEYNKTQISMMDTTDSDTAEVESSQAFQRGGVRGRGGMSGRGGRGGQSKGSGRGGGRGGRGGRGTTRGRGGRGRGSGSTRGRGGRGGFYRKSGKKQPKELCYDTALLARYRKALDQAVQIATEHNVKPIAGTTIILCDLRSDMSSPCRAAKGLGKPRTYAEVGALLGLMCKYSCEESQMIVFGDSGIHTVELVKGTILSNMDHVLQLSSILNTHASNSGPSMAKEVLMSLLRDHIQVNNLILLTNNRDSGVVSSSFREKYRRLVNEHLLFVAVDLGSHSCQVCTDDDSTNENDIVIAGFSDQILRFIAERGEGAQLVHVENIDKAYELKPMPRLVPMSKGPKTVVGSPEKPLPILSVLPQWRMCRIFISSTFLDMHAERDILTRFVFPELRSRAERLFVNVCDVDLRWGVREEDTQTNRALELCLSEVARCHMFIGILGKRYGWVPASYEVPQTPEYDWVREYPPGASVTELEINLGGLSKPHEVAERAFFYFRCNKFMSSVPKVWLPTFESESDEAAARMLRLQNRIRSSGLEVYDGYDCEWGGVVDGKPYVMRLESFAQRVLNNLWNSIEKFYPLQNERLDELTHESNQQDFFIASLRESFVGRKNLLKQCTSVIRGHSSGILIVAGKPGCGKSSLMAKLMDHFIETKIYASRSNCFVNFAGASPGSTNIVAVLRRFCWELSARFGLAVPTAIEDYKNLLSKYNELLSECAKLVAPSSLIFFVDGVDNFDNCHQAKSASWLPEKIPENVLFLVSACSETDSLKVLKQRSGVIGTVELGLLDLSEKSTVVRTTLARYGKQLDESAFRNQMKILLSKKEAGTPLYLVLACEELRMFGVFEKVTQHLSQLPQTVTQLLSFTLGRLESDVGYDLVSTSLAFLACSRVGLTEVELHMLLSLNQLLRGSNIDSDEVRSVCLSAEDMIPLLLMQRLVRVLHCFLRPLPSTRGELAMLSLAHGNIETAVRQRYIKALGVDEEFRLHRLLAEYYETVADPLRNRQWTGKSERAFTELTYHLISSGSFKELCLVVCDLGFIQAKCSLGLSLQLLDDFNLVGGTTSRAIERERTKLLSSDRLIQYQNFVLRNIHILAKHPSLTWQQALNEPADTWPAKDAQLQMSKDAGVKSTVKKLNGASVVEWLNKPSYSDPCIRTLADLPQVATALLVASDGQTLVCGFDDCTIRLYQMSTGKELKSFIGHSHQITSLCFVGIGRLCSASADDTLSLWDLSAGHRIAVLKGHKRRVNDCISDYGGKVIVSVGWDHAIKLWSGVTGECQGDLDHSRQPFNCTVLHPDNQTIAVGCWDASVKLYDIFRKERKATWRGHTSSVRCIAFSDSGRHLASASLDGDVRIWFTTTGSHVGTVHGHSGPINQLLFTKHELVTASDDHTIKVWSQSLGQPVACIGQKSDGVVVCVMFRSDGQYVVAGYHSGHVRLYDVTTGMMEWSKSASSDPVSVNCLNFSHDGASVFAGTANGTVLIVAVSGKRTQSLNIHSKSIMGIACGSRYLATASEDFEVHLVHQSKITKSTTDVHFQTLLGHQGPVTCCAFNGNETKLATGSRDMCVIIWSLESHGAVRERTLSDCHADWITCCAWSNTSDFLVTGSNDFNLKVWDTKTGGQKCVLVGHQSTVTSVAFSHGCIVSSCFDGSVKVWSHRGVEITTLNGHTQRANGCHLYVKITKVKEETPMETADWGTAVEEEEWRQKHDETKLKKTNTKVESVMVASCSDDGTIRVWLPTLSNELACLIGHSDKVVSLASANDGVISSGSLDHSVKLWQLKSDCLEKLSVSEQHDAQVTAIAFSKYGNKLATASRDGIVKIWMYQLTNEPTNTIPQCNFTLKAHTKAVNCLEFLPFKSPLLLASGSDDNSLTIWKIIDHDSSAKMKRLSLVDFESPVTSLASHLVGRTVFLVVTQWKSFCTKILQFDEHGSMIASDTIDGRKGHRDWALTCLSVLHNGKQMFVTGGADGVLNVWQLDENKCSLNGIQKMVLSSNDSTASSASESSSGGISMSEEFSDDGTSGSEESPGDRRWLTSLATSGNNLYIGDSNGHVTQMTFGRLGVKMQRKIKMHQSEITGVQIVDSYILTSSLDHTVKIWNADFEQIGLYICSSPVTTLTIPSSHDPKKSQQIVCGTQLGEIMFLQWTPPC